MLFTKELSKKLHCKYTVYSFIAINLSIQFNINVLASNIIVNAVNPGNVETPIYRYFPPLSNPFLYAIQWPMRLLVIKNPHQGAQTALHTLLAANRITGQYFSDCKVVLPCPLALRESLSEEFYNLTLEVLDNKFTSESQC